MEFVEAVEELARRSGREVPREGGGERGPREDLEPVFIALERANAYFQRQLRRHPRASRAVEYLKGRGLSGRIAAEFQLGFAPPGRDGVLRELGIDDSARAHARAGGPARRARRRSPLRPVPRPDHLPHPRCQGARRRLRRPDHRQRRAEVPQLSGDAGVPERPRALRTVAGAACGTLPGAAARGGGVHGRGGARAVGDRLRGGNPRYRRDRSPRPASVSRRQRRRVLLRRRRGGPARGMARGGEHASVDEGRPPGVVPLSPRGRGPRQPRADGRQRRVREPSRRCAAV